MGSDKVTTNIKCTFSQIKRDPFLVHTTLSKSVCYVLEKVLKKHSPSYTFAILQNISMNLSIYLDQKVIGIEILQKVAHHIVIILTFFRAYPKL